MSDRRCGALLRTSLTLTRHSLTRKGPCEGEIKVRNTSLQEARRGFSAVRFRFARRSVAPERRCKRKRYAYASRTVPELRCKVAGRGLSTVRGFTVLRGSLYALGRARARGD